MTAAGRHRARHGLQRQPDPWRAGDERLERALRLYLLLSAVPVQPVRRPGTQCASPGNVHSAHGWQDVLDPVVARYRGKVSRIYFRADAAFAMSGVYEYLEVKRINYAIRLLCDPAPRQSGFAG